MHLYWVKTMVCVKYFAYPILLTFTALSNWLPGDFHNNIIKVLFLVLKRFFFLVCAFLFKTKKYLNKTVQINSLKPVVIP